MGNNRSRIAPERTLRIIDSQTRVRYQNQRELIQFRRKLADIDLKHNAELSRLSINRYDAKMKLHELQHENGQRLLFKRLDQKNSSTSFINDSEISDESDTSTSEISSLLLHDLNASIEWEKSLILPMLHDGKPNRKHSMKTFETARSHYSSKLDASHNLFEQTESFLLNDTLSLKQHTEQMKKTIKTAVAKSARDSHSFTRRNAHNY